MAASQQAILAEALNDLNVIMNAVESETPQALIGRIINNVKTVYQYQIYTVEQQQEIINREVERVSNELLNLSHKMDTHTDVLTKHDAVIEHQRGVQGNVRTQAILESRAIGGLTKVGGDRMEFKNWNERLINAMSQIRPGSRAVFQKMMEIVDIGTDSLMWETTLESSRERTIMEEAGTALERF